MTVGISVTICEVVTGNTEADDDSTAGAKAYDSLVALFSNSSYLKARLENAETERAKGSKLMSSFIGQLMIDWPDSSKNGGTVRP